MKYVTSLPSLSEANVAGLFHTSSQGYMSLTFTVESWTTIVGPSVLLQRANTVRVRVSLLERQAPAVFVSPPTVETQGIVVNEVLSITEALYA